MSFQEEVVGGIPDQIPEMPKMDPDVNRAPSRPLNLTSQEIRLALTNALRYFPSHMHPRLAEEFLPELRFRGRIYMYRFMPSYPMYARPIQEYPARTEQAAAIMHMIQNNLNPQVAQYPYELVTYGGNGGVFQNWAQYRLTMRYLAKMDKDQTLVMYSGHPLGLFPSRPEAPRVVVVNGMVIPNYSTLDDYNRMSALGVTMYGQMTAGSYMYIGPQGIVHGTTITILNAARLYLGLSPDENLAGKVFVSSGLGGMSGAQAKAIVIAGGIGIIAEINPKALLKRHEQGWLMEYEADLDVLLRKVDQARKAKTALSIGYLGNVVDLWERLTAKDLKVELGSDQTSLHNPYAGGYYPVGLSLEEADNMMSKDPDKFKWYVIDSLRRQVFAINKMTSRGMHFWDYGNAFLMRAKEVGAEISNPDGTFRYPSYVEDIMGPSYFDYGFGPFRWVCTSGDPKDLAKTDEIAIITLRDLARKALPETRQQILDNLHWIEKADENKLVVGSQARILYSNEEGRRRLAGEFNLAVRNKEVSAPIVIGRDHHDVSGTDSPFRETANIKDGSAFCADMAVHNVIGCAMRGATWVSLHNGGGVGWGEVINGGFGMVLDGSEMAMRAIDDMISWDVIHGLARRAWAGNHGAKTAIEDIYNPSLKVTARNDVDQGLIDSVCDAQGFTY